MVSENTPPRRPILTLDELARPITRRPERLHALTASDLAVAFSQGLDLAEGKPVGHAQRVCYIATTLADSLHLDPGARAAVYFGALLHDAGVTLAAADLCRVAGVDETSIFGPSPMRVREERPNMVFADRSAITDALGEHCRLGAETVTSLELPDGTNTAVLHHHERWDGSGFPQALAGESIPVEARIVAVADVAEVLIAEQINSLVARRHIAGAIEAYSGTQLDPNIVQLLLAAAKKDVFWLGLHAEGLAETLKEVRVQTDARKSRERLIRFAEAFADMADAKGAHTPGHARRTAEGAERLAEAVGLDSAHVELISVAALLHDVGLLGVPARIMSKPDILSVSEMQIMRQHPSSSEMILQELTGFEEVAVWIARHHERPDGKGYPEMLTGEEIPLESRILAVADVYSALTAERAHRGALASEDARQVLLGAAGTQLDAELVRTFVALI